MKCFLPITFIRSCWLPYSLHSKPELCAWVRFHWPIAHIQFHGYGVVGDYMHNPPINVHDNAWAHTAGYVGDLFNRWSYEELYHPPYSPGLSPYDFDLFPKMKEPLGRRRFQRVQDILQAADCSLRTMNRLGSANVIHLLPHRWQHCKQRCWPHRRL